jgi:hypothetical protein
VSELAGDGGAGQRRGFGRSDKVGYLLGRVSVCASQSPFSRRCLLGLGGRTRRSDSAVALGGRTGLEREAAAGGAAEVEGLGTRSPGRAADLDPVHVGRLLDLRPRR